MWIKSFLFTVLCVLSLSQTALASEAFVPNSGDNSYKSVRITPEIAQNSNGNLSDILVKNDADVTIPYFINSSSHQSNIITKDYPMMLLNSYTKYDAFYLDYTLIDLPDSDVVATSINIVTQNDSFAKNIVVYGSYDDVYWEKIKEDTIYRVDNSVDLQIKFDQPQKFTHYRLMLANNLEEIIFDTVYLNYSLESNSELYFEEIIIPSFSVEELGKYTKIHINGLRNLRVKDIELETSSIFKRYVSTDGFDQELYNLFFDGIQYSQTVITLQNAKINDDTLVLTISNNDDMPIIIDAIQVSYYADEIIFEGKESEYFILEFTSDNSITAPVYDIESYKNQILNERIDTLSVEKITLDEMIEPAVDSFDFKILYNIGIIIVSLVLGILILLKLKSKKTEE